MSLQLYQNISLSLLTDLSQLTMAYSHWRSKTFNLEAVFHLYFRETPFGGGFVVACGLENVIDFVQNFSFTQSDIDYLNTLRDSKNNPLFEKEFLLFLQNLSLLVDIDAVEEGNIVFPNEPLLRITGNIIACQLLTSTLLNIINYQSLIATKAARITLAAKYACVVEMGLRRSQGIDGAISASRAAYIGGCTATTNVLAGKLLGIPVRGTHSHAWIMSFTDELDAFLAYAQMMPDNCYFLVDTYNTLAGIENAIKVGNWLAKNNFKLLGIRLDSGNLLELSQKARKLLDIAGLKEVEILASSDLDEHKIKILIEKEAPVNIWYVGTRLVTAFDDPALKGVFKLSGIKDKSGYWSYKMKLSDDISKNSLPGPLQVRRFAKDGKYLGDMLFNVDMEKVSDEMYLPQTIDPMKMDQADSHKDLLIPIFSKGRLVYPLPPLSTIRQNTKVQLEKFEAKIKKMNDPATFPVGLEEKLFRIRQDLAAALNKP